MSLNGIYFYSIIQAVLGSLEISESSLIVEAQRIMRVGERLLNCKDFNYYHT